MNTDPANAAFPKACPTPLLHHDRIVLGHGSGGRLTASLIEHLFQPLLSNPTLDRADDSALITCGSPVSGALAVSTDAHVVSPLVFPGGDIGRLAICGTVNDLAMVGAQPRWIAAAFIIEEGLAIETLRTIVRSMRTAADEAGVQVIAGDTKVAQRGKVDGLYITTTGVGVVPSGRDTHASNIRTGDAVLLSGPIGNHAIAVLAARGDLALQTDIRSDTAPLNQLVEAMFETGAEIHAMRDPTRGGLAASLNELATSSRASITVDEEAIPIDPDVAAACEILGFDPLHLANEGKLVAFVPERDAESVLAAMRSVAQGAGARRIGVVDDATPGRVAIRTPLGATRLVDMPAGELLPRIC